MTTDQPLVHYCKYLVCAINVETFFWSVIAKYVTGGCISSVIYVHTFIYIHLYDILTYDILTYDILTLAFYVLF